jgi:hypothetical protein
LTFERDGMRHAIAAAILATYIDIVGSVAFFKAVEKTDQPEITQTMLTSFTAIVGIVIPFYFGSSAYIRVQERGQSLEAESRQMWD